MLFLEMLLIGPVGMETRSLSAEATPSHFYVWWWMCGLMQVGAF